jgi:hypothetical protein
MDSVISDPKRECNSGSSARQRKLNARLTMLSRTPPRPQPRLAARRPSQCFDGYSSPQALSKPD